MYRLSSWLQALVFADNRELDFLITNKNTRFAIFLRIVRGLEHEMRGLLKL